MLSLSKLIENRPFSEAISPSFFTFLLSDVTYFVQDLIAGAPCTDISSVFVAAASRLMMTITTESAFL